MFPIQIPSCKGSSDIKAEGRINILHGRVLMRRGIRALLPRAPAAMVGLDRRIGDPRHDHGERWRVVDIGIISRQVKSGVSFPPKGQDS